MTEWSAWFSPSAHVIVAFHCTVIDDEGKSQTLVAGLSDVSDASLEKTSCTFAAGGTLSVFRVYTSDAGVCAVELGAADDDGREMLAVLGRVPAQASVPSSGVRIHEVSIPAEAFVRVGATDITAITSVIYTMAPTGGIATCDITYLPAGPPPLFDRVTRRWIRDERMGKQPSEQVLPELQRNTYVLYDDQEVFAVTQDGHSLSVVHLDGTPETYSYRGRDAKDPKYGLYEGPKGVLLHVSLDGIKYQDGTKLIPQEPYETPVDPNQLSFAATFVTPNRAKHDLDHLFGFNIYMMSTDLQQTDGRGARIFRLPPGDSKEYHTEALGSANIPTPNGVYRVSKSTSDQSTTTREFGSAGQFQQEVSVGVGVNAEVAGCGSFSANVTFKQSVEQDFKNKGAMTLSTGVLLDRDYVIDWSRLRFDSGSNTFLDDLHELAAGAVDNTVQDADYDRFVEKYGTHYAYAMRFGASYVYTRHYSSSEMTSKFSAGVSLKEEAKANFAGVVKLGASLSLDTQSSQSHTDDASLEKGELTTVGGDPGKDSLQLGEKSVPLLVDLRPIVDLINPVLFAPATNDRDMTAFTPSLLDAVHTKVKAGIHDAVRRYPELHALKPFDPTDVRPTVLDVRIDRVTFDDDFFTLQNPAYSAIELYLEPAAGLQPVGEDTSTVVARIDRDQVVTPKSISNVGARRYVLSPTARRGSTIAWGANCGSFREGLGWFVSDFTPQAEQREAYLPHAHATVTYSCRYLGGAPEYQPVRTKAEEALITSPMAVSPGGDLFIFQWQKTPSNMAEVRGWTNASDWGDAGAIRHPTLQPAWPSDRGNVHDEYSVCVDAALRACFIHKKGTGANNVEIYRTVPVTGGDQTLPWEIQIGTGLPAISSDGAGTITPDGKTLFTLDPGSQTVACCPLSNAGAAQSFLGAAIPRDARILALGVYGPLPGYGESDGWDVVAVYRRTQSTKPIICVLSRETGFTAAKKEATLPYDNVEAAFAILSGDPGRIGGLFVVTTGQPVRDGYLHILPWAEY
jgi:hypothetical protein